MFEKVSSVVVVGGMGKCCGIQVIIRNWEKVNLASCLACILRVFRENGAETLTNCGNSDKLRKLGQTAEIIIN